jgi:hypothetical protein
MWIEIAIGVIVSSLLFYTTYRLLRYRIAFQNLGNEYLQKLSDNQLLINEINRLNQQINNKELEQSDGFLKFLSDSRDWAFEYIEQVQLALADFDETMEPAMEWFNKYGLILGETAHTDVLKRISEAYDKLKSVLPENTETPNN